MCCGCANVDSSAPVFSLKGYNKISPWILNLSINETEQFMKGLADRENNNC